MSTSTISLPLLDLLIENIFFFHDDKEVAFSPSRDFTLWRTIDSSDHEDSGVSMRRTISNATYDKKVRMRQFII